MKKKAKKDLGEATRASVKKEMAKPRMAKSVRIAEQNLARKIHDFRGTKGLAMVQIRCLVRFETKSEAFA